MSVLDQFFVVFHGAICLRESGYRQPNKIYSICQPDIQLPNLANKKIKSAASVWFLVFSDMMQSRIFVVKFCQDINRSMTDRIGRVRGQNDGKGAKNDDDDDNEDQIKLK